MSTVLIATVSGLVTAICWGIGDWFSARSTKSHDSIEINFGVQVASFVLVILLALFSDFHMPTAATLLRICISSSLLMAGYLVFVKALSSGVVGIIVPIGNSYPFFTVFLSIVLLGETFSMRQIAAFACIITGASILAYEKNRRKIPLKELHRESLLAAAAAILFGTGYFIVNPVVGEVSWQELTVITDVTITILATLLMIAHYRRRVLSVARRSLSTPGPVLVGTTGTLGLAALYVGSTSAGNVVIPTLLSSCSSLVASLMGTLIDKEKIGVFKRVGAVILVAGVVILNLA